MAHVAASAKYSREDQSEIAIDFDVHYLVQMLEARPKAFRDGIGDRRAPLNSRNQESSKSFTLAVEGKNARRPPAASTMSTSTP